jgi:hypothetical protein
MRKVVFTFKEDGSVETDANGFKGKDCVKLTEEMLKGLDAKLESRKVKGEFYTYEKEKTHISV